MREIKGYESYKVTKDGKVWSTHSHIFLKGRHDKDGYRDVTLCGHGKPVWKKVHRLVAEMYIPNPKNKPCVNHIDGVKTNNDISNLEWVTVGENNQHAFNLGLNKGRKGEDHHNTTLSENDVLEIRRMSKTVQRKEIAKIFNISVGHVGDILKRKKWRHI